MLKVYDELSGKALRTVDKAMGLLEKHLFNFDGNQEEINWIPRGAGFIDFRGYDPISKTFVEGGFEHDKRGRVKSYVVLSKQDGNVVPDFLFGVSLKGNGFSRHIKAFDKNNAIAESIVADSQGQWNQAAFHIVNWLDDLPGSMRKLDDSTWAYFEGFDTAYA